MKKNIWHIVLISFWKNTPQKTREEIYQRYQTLAEDCGGEESGILFWKVGRNLDLRKDVHLVEIAVFKDDDALQVFKQHPRHKEITGMLCKVANWQVGDICHPFVTERVK